MANRRSYGDAMMQPASPLTNSGASYALPSEGDEPQTPMEQPDTMRRRLTPMVGDVTPKLSAIDTLLSMLKGRQ